MRVQRDEGFRKAGDSSWLEVEPAVGIEPTTDGLQMSFLYSPNSSKLFHDALRPLKPPMFSTVFWSIKN
jgi:hypothetical protein